MSKTIFTLVFLITGHFLVSSCQNESIEHINSTRLIILQKIPVIGNKIDENFKATLELLYPHECHDTVFIQDQVFLERIDLKDPVKKEFVISPSLMRDFFGSNNPDKKRSLREELFYIGDSSFEKNPGKEFLIDSQISMTDQSGAISEYLMRNRKNALVYLISNDTACKNYTIGGASWSVHHDAAKLNCSIVSELRKKPKEELIHTAVILVLLPPGIPDTATKNPGPGATGRGNPSENSMAAVKPAVRGDYHKGPGSPCPPDSVIINTNERNNSIIHEFRNLLHYIATTRKDDSLKRTFREDAFREIHRIPDVRIEGIPANDLHKFLNSGFSSEVIITPIRDHCRMIVGILIREE